MAYFCDASMGRSAMSHANFSICLGIYYPHVRGLRHTKLEFYDNVCASNFDIICLSETWLNDLCYDHNLFPNIYTRYRFDRPYIKKVRGGGVLTAITASLGSCNRRYDLELCSECVWVEIPTAEGISILIGNHYFPPDTKPEVITDHFRHLENTLDTNNTRAILLGDLNAPNFNWESGAPLPKCHYYSKLKGLLYTPPHVFLA
jgi:exonuclease III